MIIRGHMTSCTASNCVICKKKSNNFVTFKQKTGGVKIEICLCNEHRELARTDYFDKQMDLRIKAINCLCHSISDFGNL